MADADCHQVPAVLRVLRLCQCHLLCHSVWPQVLLLLTERFPGPASALVGESTTLLRVKECADLQAGKELCVRQSLLKKQRVSSLFLPRQLKLQCFRGLSRYPCVPLDLLKHDTNGFCMSQVIMLVNTIFLASLGFLTLPLYTVCVQMGGDYKAHLLSKDVLQGAVRAHSLKASFHSHTEPGQTVE